MFTRWTLENFKPVKGAVTLDLKGITVLAGLNSSGKSSVLQSILAVSQTLSHQSVEKPLLLNGNSVQLGSFEGVKNQNAESDDIGIGFTLVPRYGDATEALGRRRRVGAFSLPGTLKAISVDAHFLSPSASTSSLEGPRLILKSSRVVANHDLSSVQGRESVARKITVTAVASPLISQDEYLRRVASEYLPLVPGSPGSNYTVRIDIDDSALAQRIIAPSTGAELTRLQHFLPGRVIRRFELLNRIRINVSFALDHAEDFDEYHLPDPILGMEYVSKTTLTPEVCEELNKHDGEHGRFPGGTARDAMLWASRSTLKTRAKASFTSRIKQLLHTHVVRSVMATHGFSDDALGLETESDNFGAVSLEGIASTTVSFFNQRLRYLGPLRADPQAAQGFAPSSEADDVGVRGEYAAAVFDANYTRLVQWWDPFSASLQQGYLGGAVDAWIRYLGVAHHVGTRETGPSGVSWTIKHLENSAERPLHSVGIGVSQVLPILVCGLLSPPGTVILIEQPELHLHSKAQAKLADFFLGLSHCEKQCIIETHSDALVSQLRFRIVELTAEKAPVSIYFVQQDNQGDASFQKIQISSTGNILNWPDGFFDESMKQEERILDASVRRRKSGY